MKTIIKEVESRFQAGQSKKKVWRQLRNDDNAARLAFCLNNTALPEQRSQFKIINYFLMLSLVLLTADKTMAAVVFGRFDLYFIASLVVPIVNVYILLEIWNYRRRGYQFLFVLSCLALIRSENHTVPMLILLGIQIALAAFLHLNIFPSSANIVIAPKTTEKK